MDITPELLNRYRKGLCSPAQMRAVEAWAERHEMVDDADFPLPGWEAELEQEIWTSLDNYRQKPPVRAMHSRRWFTGGITAAATLVVAAGVLLFLYYGRSGKNNALLAEKNAVKAVWDTIKTLAGERRTVQLPDGSQVILNSGSELAYSRQFSTAARNVFLSGEAFFTVVADARRPFTIHSPLTQVQVLGTSFNMQAYAEDTAAWVTVEEGKVALTSLPYMQGARSITLTAGEQGVAGQSGSLRSRNVYAGNYHAWTRNQLLIQDKTLPETALLLQRWFNKKVVIDSNALQHERFTGRFNNPQPEQVLKAIAFVVKCRYSINDQEIHLY